MIMVSSVVMVAPFTSEARTSTTTTESGDFEYTLEINNIDDGTTWIEKYIGNDTKVIIPEEIKSRKVVGISSEAFKDYQQITDISIPNSVKKLGYKVFDDTSWYKKLFNNASDGVIYINNIAYAYKGEMQKNTTITFDYGTVSIAGGAFGGEENLSKIILPNSLTYIGEEAFYCCENLNDFVIPNSLKSIGDHAFFECTNLINIIIPDSVEYIGASAFYGCWDLTNIVLGKGLNRINSSTFSYCTGLTSITIPDNINYIASEAFEDCYQLDNISISDNIFLIDADAFRNTKWYENQPDGVVYIGNFVYSYKGEMPEKIKDFKIYGYKGTAAETYAKNNGFKFVALSNDLPTPSISSLTNTTSAIKLLWNKIEGAYGYRVYQKTSSGWSKLKDTTATSLTDSAVTANQTKTYTIRCINKNGKTISGYNSKGWSKKYTAATPKITKLTNASKGVSVTWNKVTGVYGYRHYRKYAGGSWTKVKDTTSTSFTDSGAKKDKKVTYTVRCIDKKGNAVSNYNKTGWSITKK